MFHRPLFAAALLLAPLASAAAQTINKPSTGSTWRQDNDRINSPNSPSASAMTASAANGATSSAASGSQSVNFQDRLQTGAVGIPSLAVGNNCGLSASLGAAVPGITIGGGYAWEGSTCTLIALAFSLEKLGQADAALAMLCQDDKVKRAMAASGAVCPGTPVAASALVLPYTQTTVTQDGASRRSVTVTNYNTGTGG